MANARGSQRRVLEAGRNLDPVAEREPVPDELLSDTEKANRGAN
jgi:hypothetical protein